MTTRVSAMPTGQIARKTAGPCPHAEQGGEREGGGDREGRDDRLNAHGRARTPEPDEHD
ncbi:MAG: hypothetical protein ACRDMW_06330 [Gaiellaceae bacterium]